MRGLTGMACAVLAGGTAWADVSVYLTRSGTEQLWRTYPAGEAIDDLPALGDEYQRVRVHAANETGDIGQVWLDGSRSLPLEVLIAGASTLEFPAAGTPIGRAGGDWAGLSPSPGIAHQVQLAASVARTTGSVTAGRVVRLEADVLAGTVMAVGADSPTEGAIGEIAVRNRVDAAAPIRASSGSIRRVRVGTGEAGDGVYASVISEAGTIDSLEVAGEVSISLPGGIRARDGIRLIRVTSSDESGYGLLDAAIHADTGEHAGSFDPRLGTLIQIECGTLAGSVRARLLDDGLGNGQRVSVRAQLILADIHITERMAGRIEAWRFDPPARVRVGGDMLASIIAPGGITSLDVGGNIDTLFRCVPTVISSAGGAIGSITVGGNAIANTECDHSLVISAAEGIGRLHVSGDALWGVHSGTPANPSPLGELNLGGSWYGGELIASRVDSLEIGGSMEGSLAVSTLPPTSRIRIGGPRPGALIVTTPGGLSGEVITNASAAPSTTSGPVYVKADGGYGWHTWDGVGTCTIRGADLGGGSIGAAPFALQELDCEPLPCATCIMGEVPQRSLTSSGLLLRFNGPIKKDLGEVLRVVPADGDGNPVAGAAPWPGVQDVQVDSRSVRVLTAAELPAGVWTVQSVADGISCDALLMEGVAVVPFSYPFRVTGCGSSDFNRDTEVGTDHDIEAFFACVGGNCCPACTGSDFDGDGDVATDADIEAFFRVLSGGNC